MSMLNDLQGIEVDVAALIAERACLLNACELAYLAMLQMPHNALRARSQTTFVALRDAIAKTHSRTSEDVQDEYESIAVQKQCWAQP